jgi:hypothetical protein
MELQFVEGMGGGESERHSGVGIAIAPTIFEFVIILRFLFQVTSW